MSLKSITRRLFGLTAIDSLELKRNSWYIDGEPVTATASQLNTPTTALVTAANLGADVAGTNLTGGNGTALRVKTNIYKFGIEYGTAPGVNVPCTAITPSDALGGVYMFDIGTGVFDRRSEYTVGSSYLIKTAGSNDTGKYLYIFWNDVVTS